MLTYSYTARNQKTGQKVKAEIEAENERAAGKLLVERGFTPLQIILKTGKPGIGFRNRIGAKDRVIFSRQLSTLINAGLPLLQSLNTVRGQTSNKALKDITSEIITAVEAGSPFAAALSKYPAVFDEVYVSLIAAGEASGKLHASLERLATQQEKDAEVVSKIRGAMIYPGIVLLVLFALIIFMMTTVLPQVENLYRSLPGVKLPFITLWLMGIANFIVHLWWILILVLGAVIFGGRRWLRTPKGKQTLDKIKLRAWPVAPLFKKLYMARFARTASSLIGSGVPMIQMLNTTAEAVGNSQVAASIHRATEQVKGGKTLSESLEGDPNFLDLVPDMIHIGEQSGALEDMMGKVADYYEREVDSQIKSVSTIIEPVLMIIVGIMALIIVAAVLLPIYSLGGKFSAPR
ncbi:type II secretion system F family protein [Candidatus Saccharibacteria bacterium]|nr:type II secretion system F family protein [Candidatus Saccharibacteria bacterium]